MTVARTIVATAVLSTSAACGSMTPTTPSNVTGLGLTCDPQTALAGEIVVCLARANGTGQNVSFDPSTVWSSSDPSVLVSLGFGGFMGKSDTQAAITAIYQGHSASALVTVKLQDVLRATAAALQGTFRVGTSVTMWLQGFYGVASGDSGTLTLVITNQDGVTLGTSTPLAVLHGGDRYLISSTLVLPPGTTQVCRAGVLQIGSTTLTVIPDVSLVPCVVVQQ
jgi:hypothetical protein